MRLFVDKYIAVLRSLIRYTPKRRKYADFGKYNIVEPATVSPVRHVPEHIEKPYYYETCEIKPPADTPDVKNAQQIEGMTRSCQLASSILKDVENIIKVGTTTDDIDKFVHEKCIENNAYPSPLWYRGFPKSICTSVNNVAAHGIPDNRELMDGDIINVDITVFLNGYHGDCSNNFLVGNVDEQGKELVSITEQCLEMGLSVCGPGTPFKEIGFVIQDLASKNCYTVVPALTGHGIGTYFHGPPDIYHTHNFYPGNMEAGMTFTIEPVISCGSEMLEMLEDGWTLVTADGARTAQKEHTILITEDGCKILTDKH